MYTLESPIYSNRILQSIKKYLGESKEWQMFISGKTQKGKKKKKKG